MVRRQRTTLCPEGWYYLFVIAFILGGAALRGMNLLVILAGALIGPLLFNWRFARLMLRRMRVERRLPPRVFAGQTLTVFVTLHNDRRALSSWALMIEDRIRCLQTNSVVGPTAVRLMIPRVAPRHNRMGSYRLRLTGRGRYQLGPMHVSSRFPLGLARARMTLTDPAHLTVCPRLGRLTRRWLHVTRQQHVGSQRTARQHGLLEGDYYGLREWRPGDSQRWIHWRTSAKLGELSVRQFEQQRNRDVSLILDLWQPRTPSTQDRLLVELAVSFAATAVGDICRRGGAHIIVGVVGVETEYWNGAASSVLTHEVWDHLAVARATDQAMPWQAVTHVWQRATPNAQTIVISTRDQSAVEPTPNDSPGMPGLGRNNLIWINCANGGEKDYFEVDTT